MSANTKILQLYYKPEQVGKLDTDFTPYDNTDNLRPDLREWYVWDKTYEEQFADGTEYLGYVSWKFKEKTNLTGQQVLAHINANPGADVYLFNPCILNEAVFINSWEQGDIHHPNISDIGNAFLHKLGNEGIDVRSIVLDQNVSIFANYVVGNRKFWDGFMAFSRQLFTESEKDENFKHLVFGEGLSNYAHDKSLPNFTFLIERLLPTYLDLSDLDVVPYLYTAETLPEKYRPYIEELYALSKLKVEINKHNSDELYVIWNTMRNVFLRRYGNGILGLE